MKAPKCHKSPVIVQYTPNADSEGTRQTTTGEFCCVSYMLKICIIRQVLQNGLYVWSSVWGSYTLLTGILFA